MPNIRTSARKGKRTSAPIPPPIEFDDDSRADFNSMSRIIGDASAADDAIMLAFAESIWDSYTREREAFLDAYRERSVSR